MKVISTAYDLDFLPRPNREQVVLSSELPPLDLCTAVLVFAFEEDRLLLNHNKKWGWALPAGHIEKGEKIEEAARREVYEETQARIGRMGLLGHIHFHIDGPRPPGYKYPYPDSYMVCYWAEVAGLEPFEEDAETRARGLFSPDELEKVPGIFDQIQRDLYAVAFKAATGKAFRD